MALTEKKTGVSRQFAASSAVAGLARDQVASALREWELSFLVPDAALVMGELVANAIVASGLADVIKVHVGFRVAEVVLAVWDRCDGRPLVQKVELSLETLDLREENFDDNGGWGLSIVESLASRCWVEPTRPSGKWVCAALKLEERR
ncbi:ATP-binding protein [Actinomadura sp. 7K507]|uniref:ATP-binding protein n=1 Tax=Actinomadura sp. 7K507 TaxID=2530365 RepID=UPI00105274FA|nr:ATP-binding protein [Actinomadura sp. 7K507]TDC76746.1 ATP-binding protein [Actinomadura sp. 7K507]